jgi:hypothetical protein
MIWEITIFIFIYTWFCILFMIFFQNYFFNLFFNIEMIENLILYFFILSFYEVNVICGFVKVI